MNLYFLFEGDKTEPLLYTKWINLLLPKLTKIDFIQNAAENNFYIFSGGGIPSIYQHTVNAIKDINDNKKFDYLIICVDSEDILPEKRIEKFEQYIANSKIKLIESCRIVYIVQNACIETWFLGNKKIVKRNPDGTLLKEYFKYYNVIENDPELMGAMGEFKTRAQFHYSYFREVLKEHNLVYKKAKLEVVTQEHYLLELQKRVKETTHLNSLKLLLQFFLYLEGELNTSS